jgi:hypothetical protein
MSRTVRRSCEYKCTIVESPAMSHNHRLRGWTCHRQRKPRRDEPQRSPSGRRMGPRQPERMRLLVVVDGTDASTRVLRYIGPFAIGCRGVEIQLVVPRSAPTACAARVGGAELPGGGSSRSRRTFAPEQQEWSRQPLALPARILRTARTELERAVVDGSRIATCTSSPLDAGLGGRECVVASRAIRNATRSSSATRARLGERHRWRFILRNSWCARRTAIPCGLWTEVIQRRRTPWRRNSGASTRPTRIQQAIHNK